jgi:hypothetical protein
MKHKVIVNQISYEERMRIRNEKLSSISDMLICDEQINQVIKILWEITNVLCDETKIKIAIQPIIDSFHELEDACFLAHQFLIREFSNDPNKAKYFFDYSISKLDTSLQEVFDYKKENFTIAVLDEKLEEDVLFGLHNGKEVKASGIDDSIISDFSNSSFKLSYWALSFNIVVRTLEKITIYYPEQFNLSFRSNRFEPGENIFDLNDKSEIPQFIDDRNSKKAPTIPQKIKALKEYCPELWQRLSRSQSKKIQQIVIHAITGANREDSYKFSFGPRSKQLNKIEIADFVSLENSEE